MTSTPISEILAVILTKKQYDQYEKEKMRWVKRDVEKVCKQIWKSHESSSYCDKLIAEREGWLADAQKQVDKITAEIDDIRHNECKGYVKRRMKRLCSLLDDSE